MFSLCGLNLKSFQRRVMSDVKHEGTPIFDGLLRADLINSDSNSTDAISTLAFECTLDPHQRTPLGLHQCKLI